MSQTQGLRPTPDHVASSRAPRASRPRLWINAAMMSTFAGYPPCLAKGAPPVNMPGVFPCTHDERLPSGARSAPRQGRCARCRFQRPLASRRPKPASSRHLRDHGQGSEGASHRDRRSRGDLPCLLASRHDRHALSCQPRNSTPHQAQRRRSLNTAGTVWSQSLCMA